MLSINHGDVWWVHLQGDLYIFQLCQIEYLHSKIPLVVQVLHPSHCKIILSLWPGFQYAENLHHAQFGQFCIWVSTLDPIFQAACS